MFRPKKKYPSRDTVPLTGKLYVLSSDPVFVHFVYMGFAVYILPVDFASALSAIWTKEILY